MISKNKIAYIRSLHNKSSRISEGIFIVEWAKCMSEFLNSDFDIVEWFFTEEFAWSSLLQAITSKWKNIEYQIIADSELTRITTLTSNNSGVLLVRMRQAISPKINKNEIVLVLDKINDPGNLGTIIRIADWYGISHIIASWDTVDCYNPKVLMATIGSFTRVSVFYTDLDQYLSEIEWPIYGAYLDGENIHNKTWTSQWAHLVIWSEAHGISPNLEKYITDKITIPRFWQAESLNAGVATAIIVDRMKGDQAIEMPK